MRFIDKQLDVGLFITTDRANDSLKTNPSNIG